MAIDNDNAQHNSITEHSHRALLEAQAFLQTALAASEIGIFRHYFGDDAQQADVFNSRSRTWNFNTAERYGYPPGTTITPDIVAQRIHPEDIVAMNEKTEAAFRDGAVEFQTEYRVIWRDGSLHWLLVKSIIERDAKGAPLFLSGAIIDITQRKLSEDRIQYLATHDGLTGLPNRAMFSTLLNHTIDTARRYSHKFAVVFIDLDRFKSINDALGHHAGDVLLQEVSKRLLGSVRSSDIVARLSGDEFMILVQETNDKLQAEVVARKILAEVLKPVTIAGQECRVTASVGIAMFPEDAEDELALMKHADMAMYLAKEEGKNGFRFYDKNIKSQSLEKIILENSLRHALENNEFALNFQAKLDLKTDRINGVEALLRWSSPALGAVSPAQFIPVAEEAGLILPIGRWVLKTACMQNAAWQKQGLPHICVAVNLSPKQFIDEGLIEYIKEALQQSGLAPELLELEITESMVMHDVEGAVKLLHEIKALGVRIAIDDFGTGYSSLAQLKSFPIDTLKVDRSFIREVIQNSDDRAITEAIITMGKNLSLTIVAEGVETVEQQSFLRSQACDEMQGFYFSKPVVADQFADLLRNHVALPHIEPVYR